MEGAVKKRLRQEMCDVKEEKERRERNRDEIKEDSFPPQLACDSSPNLMLSTFCPD